MGLKMDTYLGYKARFARPEEAQRAYDFYNRDIRPRQVYLRRWRVFKQAVYDGRVLIVTDNENRIVAASAAYPVAGGREIPIKAGIDGKPTEYGRAIEIGSVLKDPEKTEIKGFFHNFIYTSWMLEIAKRAGKDWPEYSMIITNVQEQLKNMLARLESGKPENAEATGSVLRWERFVPTADLEKAVGNTMDSTELNFGSRKIFLFAPLWSLLPAARQMMQYCTNGYLTNREGDHLEIDLTELRLSETASAIISKRGEFEQLKQSADTMGRPDNTAWADVGKRFVPSIRSSPVGTRAKVVQLRGAGVEATGTRVIGGLRRRRKVEALEGAANPSPPTRRRVAALPQERAVAT
jgi:hypothetical protein